MNEEIESTINIVSRDCQIPAKYLIGASENISDDDRAGLEKYLNAKSAEQKILFQRIQDICIHRIVVSKRGASRFNKPKAKS